MLQRPDPFNAQCPTRQVLDRIGDKWAVLILIMLDRETLRFNELRRRIENISQKMLSQTLKSLERDGLVRREVFATVPVTVEYSLTELGRTLAATVQALTLWAESHIGAVQEPRSGATTAGKCACQLRPSGQPLPVKGLAPSKKSAQRSLAAARHRE